MATPYNPDAVPRVPRTPHTPQSTLPDLDPVSPPSLTRSVRQRAMLAGADPASAVPPAEEPDSPGWFALHGIYAAFLARQAMEQAFAALRGDGS